jgi:general stress protein 26
MAKDVRVHSPDAGARLRELVEGIRFAMVTSVDPEGTLQSRPLPPQHADEDGTLWFIASRRSSLAHQLRTRPDVLVTWGDVRSRRYLSVNGTATVLHDPAKAAELWDAAIRTWFPDGPDDPEVAVIKVALDISEYREPLPAPVAFPQFMEAATSGETSRMRRTVRSDAQHAPQAQES